MRKIILFFTLVSLSLGLHAQQSKLDEAWKKFQNNERASARKLFSEAVSNPESAEEAHLALSILYAEEGYSIEAMKSFQEFMKISSNPYPYMDVLWSSYSVTAGNGKKGKERLSFLKGLLKDKNLPGYLAARLHANLGYHFQALGKFKDSKKEFDQVGSVIDWTAVGTFDNISASGFDKEWAPLKNPSESYTFKDKNGASVKWFPITEVRNDRWIDHEYYFYSGNSIIFTQTFINSPTTQKVQLRIGVSGSVKMWLNDNLVLSEIEERNNGFDSYIVETTLKQGYNRVLIQIGESEADNSNFLLRITDENGTNIQGLTADHTSKNYDKGAVEAKVITNTAIDFFEKKVASNPSFLNLILLSKAYSNIDMRLQARKTLVKAETMAPNCSYVQLKLINVYSSEGNRTAIAKVIEWLKDHDKDNPLSIGIIYDEAVENENYAKADSLLEMLETIEGKDAEDILEKKISLYIAREKNEELVEVIETGYKKYPENYQFVLYKALLENSRKNSPKALKVVKKYTKNNYSISSQKELASLYIQNGQVEAGLALYDEMIENEPVGIGLYQNLSDFYFQLQQYDKAIRLLNKAIEIAPYTTYNLNQRAKCFAEKGDDLNAKADYQRALELSSTNFNARHKLREMAGMKKDIFENFEKVDVYQLFKEAGGASDYPEDNSVILLNSVQRVVYQDGASEEKHTMVAKVFNAAGIDDWKEYYIRLYSTQRANIEKVEVLKANGSKLEAERSGSQVVFTNLEAGDGIHITYTVENYHSGKLAPYFTDNHYFTLFYPVKISSYSLLVHPDVKFKHQFSNGGFEPVKTTKEGMDLYVWEKKDIPSIKDEPFMSHIVDFGEVLYLSSIPNWKFVSNWYSDLARTKAKSDFEVKETAAKIFNDKDGGTNANLSKLEKAKLIHDYIVENIRYSSVSFRQSGLIPQKASKVINTRVGDCKDVSTLFVALCKEAGIDSARLVLINTRDNGKKDILLPSIDFNHCIGNLTIDGQQYFVELTSDKNGFHTFPNTLKNSFALTIYDENEGKSEAPFYLSPTTKIPDNITRSSTVKISGKEMSIETNSVKTGDWASEMRYAYSDIPESERRKKLLESLTGDNASVKLNTYSFNGLDAISDSIVYNYNYTVGNAVTQITDLNVFSIPWAGKHTSIQFMSAEERKYPVNFWDYIEFDLSEEKITISFPEGKKLAETPKNVKLTCGAADYSINYKMVGGKLEAVRSLTIKKDIISPAEYEELKKFFEKVVEEDTRQLAFK